MVCLPAVVGVVGTARGSRGRGLEPSASEKERDTKTERVSRKTTLSVVHRESLPQKGNLYTELPRTTRKARPLEEGTPRLIVGGQTSKPRLEGWGEVRTETSCLDGTVGVPPTSQRRVDPLVTLRRGSGAHHSHTTHRIRHGSTGRLRRGRRAGDGSHGER